ncbi:YifB family Mg chelatase-like AAA ATPase [soil metagenome]
MAGAAHTRSVTLDGMNGRPVEIEVDISSGLPRVTLVGLPDTSVAEARDRCRSAIVNSGRSWPDRRVTINLAPSSLPKTGSHYDLAIAVAVLMADGVVPRDCLRDTVILGELALDGRLRAIPGVLPATLAASEAGCSRVLVPEVNVSEAELVEGIAVTGARSLRHVVAMLLDEEIPDDPPVEPLARDQGHSWLGADRLGTVDLIDIAGQHEARLSIVVAAAGGHHVQLVGPPGIGKTMLAQRLPGLLPDLDYVESIEATAVHSVAGLLRSDTPLLVRPPFVDPHHTASAVSIVGGGSKTIRPGALSLAHRGVLFMDEAPEFASNVLDALRQPLESGHVVISRAAQTAMFPARFQLILASNPCPCGLNSATSNLCECSPLMRRRYKDRISGPIRDRIDIHRSLAAPGRPELAAALSYARSTAEVADVVREARARQSWRLRDTPWRLNVHVPGPTLRRTWPLTADAAAVVDRDVNASRLSARAADRVMRLAWTIADLAGVDRPGVDEVRTALALRKSLPLDGHLREMVQRS